MPSIHIERSHKLPMKEAKVAVERVATSIAERFDVDYGWEGSTLHFERSGIDGHIALSKGKVQVAVNLGFLLIALRGPIERSIHEHIDREFAES